MKSKLYKPGMPFLCGLLLATAISAQPVTKEFHKQYTPGPNTTLDISNKYGNVVFENTSQNQVTIDVKVSVELPNRERAEKLLSYIDVKFAEDGDKISAKTVIDNNFNFSGWGSSSRKFSINYSVKMPAAINLTVANRYGNTEIEKVNGLVNLDIKYGNLTADEFTRGNEKPMNHVSLAYGKASISSVDWMDILARYAGNLEINKSQALLIDSKYSKLKLDETSSVVCTSKYDNLRIGEINNLVLDAGYSDVVVETLSKKLKFDGGYGAFTVEDIPSGFESIETDTRYIGVKLGIDKNASYNLEAKLSYGDLKFNEDNYKNQKRIIQNSSNETAGIVGNESSPTATVKITASYGSVRLDE